MSLVHWCLLLVGASLCNAMPTSMGSNGAAAPTGTRRVRVSPMRLGRAVLTSDGVTLLECSDDTPCPTGYTCMQNPMAPGALSCFDRVNEPSAKKAGSCPPPNLVTAQRNARTPANGGNGGGAGAGGQRGCCSSHGYMNFFRQRGMGAGMNGDSECLFDSDCNGPDRCCRSDAASRACVPPMQVAADGQSVVTQLIDGQFAVRATSTPGLTDGTEGKASIFNPASATLVQSSGKNVLVDTGTPGDKNTLFKALEKLGLSWYDIDYVVITHAYPDHWGNAAFFTTKRPFSVASSFDNFDHRGSLFIRRWKRPSTDPAYYVFGDKNVEIVKPDPEKIVNEDDYVIVRNAKDYGTVVISGDLFYNADDMTNNDKTAAGLVLASTPDDIANVIAARAKAACLADYIIPGHGTIFKVTDAYKQQKGCGSAGK